MNKIFFAVVLLVVLATAKAGDKDEMKKKIHEMAGKCMETHKLTEDQARETKEGAKTPEQKCFIECMFQSMGFINDNGNLDKAKAEAIAEKKFKGEKLEKAKKGIEACSKEGGATDKCENASKLHDCIRENFKEFVKYCHGKKDD